MTMRPLATYVVLAVLALARPSAAALPGDGAGFVNADFESGSLGAVPDGWKVPPLVAEAGYGAALSAESPRSGKSCARVGPLGAADSTKAFGNLLQSLDATPFRGRSFVIRAAVRARAVAPRDRAQLWVRVDRPDQRPGFFDNMADRPITSQDWKDYAIRGEIAPDAERISFGIMTIGSAEAWIDDVRFEITGGMLDGCIPPRPLEGRALENVVAFAKLYGYVRWFHPSDEASKTDWDALAIEGVQIVEGARSAEELREALADLFGPIAPTVALFAAGTAPPAPARAPAEAIPTRSFAWRHRGAWLSPASNTYGSERRELSLSEAAVLGAYESDLGSGVACRVPLAVFADAGGTLPRATAVRRAKAAERPPEFRPRGIDRATRLGAVVIAWNVMRHFFPYFDDASGAAGAVSTADWDAAFRRALLDAATDAEEAEFLETLRLLTAELRDGHVHVQHACEGSLASPSFAWDWIEDRIVVTHVLPESALDLRRGDVVVRVDGVPASEALANREAFVSSATPQWRRHRALNDLRAGAPGRALSLEVERGPGTKVLVTAPREVAAWQAREPRPESVADLAPGIVYCDLDRVDDAAFAAALPRLAAATGVVFDLRGYPKNFAFLSHLSDREIRSARWLVPVAVRPDRDGVTFDESGWPLAPKSPRIGGKIAFLTDGRAISAAETCLGIVEHFRLAEIVGSPTAGTNGNVNPFTLPGDYQVAFTGMKVLKHDGSRHHGIGILPTVPVSRTIAGVAAGRDEVLERAVEIVSR